MVRINRKLAVLTAKYLVGPNVAFVIAQRPRDIPGFAYRLTLLVDDVGGVIEEAATHGNVPMLEAIKQSRHASHIESHKNAIRKKAAKHGCKSVIRWLEHCGVPDYGNMCYHAARAGQFEMLRWLVHRMRAQTEVMPTTTCKAAAEGGHLAILKWLRSKGFPWDADVCTAAAGGAHKDVVRWARDNGCSYDEYECAIAYAWNHGFTWNGGV
ncbi:MAG: ankyrin repeat domain-containing protein [Patescibacteria group bacterium]|nr:ankyrin repeat domain-containing protein [Patescibacteria group bacterium]